MRVLQILKDNNGMVNATDDQGNTALHNACATTAPSLEVVHALLLAGCPTAAKNDDGLTAFHLACLNGSDSQHKLKKFLIFKGNQNVNPEDGQRRDRSTSLRAK